MKFIKRRRYLQWMLLSILLSRLGASAVFAVDQNGKVTLLPESSLWLVGDSTLHAYSSKTSAIEMNMELDVTKNASFSVFERIRNGQMKVLDVQIPVTTLKSGKGQLDKNMYKSLKAEQNPKIIFHMSSYEVSSATSPNSFMLVAKGDLTVAGQTKPVELNAKVSEEKSVKIEGSRDLLMTQFGIKPPTILGAIRTHDRVVVNFDLSVE